MESKSYERQPNQTSNYTINNIRRFSYITVLSLVYRRSIQTRSFNISATNTPFQFKGEQIMDMIIYDLDVNSVDCFINQDSDIYARIIRKATQFDHTVDLQITVKCIAVDDSNIIIEYPNGCGIHVKIPSNHYHKIEVM